MMTPRVILASQSPRRHQLLNLVGIAHEVRPADVDETFLPGEQPIAHAERLACAKAIEVSREDTDAIVIGADTIVVVDGDVLGKPRDESHAAEMLGRLSGRTHIVHTAVAVAWRGEVRSGVESVDVTFRALDEKRIAAYIATGEPMDKAGAYGIQGFGATIVQSVGGDYFAVMGLALGRLVDLTDALGIAYLFGPLHPK